MEPEVFSQVFDSCMRLAEAMHDNKLIKLSDGKREFDGFVNWDEVSIYHKKNSTTRWVRRGELVALREKRNLSKIACKDYK